MTQRGNSSEGLSRDLTRDQAYLFVSLLKSFHAN